MNWSNQARVNCVCFVFPTYHCSEINSRCCSHYNITDSELPHLYTARSIWLLFLLIRHSSILNSIWCECYILWTFLDRITWCGQLIVLCHPFQNPFHRALSTTLLNQYLPYANDRWFNLCCCTVLNYQIDEGNLLFDDSDLTMPLMMVSTKMKWIRDSTVSHWRHRTKRGRDIHMWWVVWRRETRYERQEINLKPLIARAGWCLLVQIWFDRLSSMTPNEERAR